MATNHRNEKKRDAVKKKGEQIFFRPRGDENGRRGGQEGRRKAEKEE